MILSSPFLYKKTGGSFLGCPTREELFGKRNEVGSIDFKCDCQDLPESYWLLFLNHCVTKANHDARNFFGD